MEAASRGVGRGVSIGRLLRVGLLAVLVAVVVNLVIRTVTVALVLLAIFRTPGPAVVLPGLEEHAGQLRDARGARLPGDGVALNWVLLGTPLTVAQGVRGPEFERLSQGGRL